VTRAVYWRITRALQWLLIAVAIFPVQTVHASDNPIITQPTDFWFSYSETTQFTARTYDPPGYPSDPHLWLYNSDTGVLVAANDDYYGLQSNIDISLPAGNYRLRAGICCGNPDAWNTWNNTWNVQYELSFNGNPINTTTTTPETTTTWAPTTTSTEPTTTTSTTVPETTVPVTEPPTTTSTVVETTTTTTTAAPTVTSVIQTTSTTVTTVAPTVAPSTEAPIITTAPPVVIPPPASTTSTTTTVVSTSTSTSIPESTSPTTTVPEEVNDSTAVVDELVSSITELNSEEIDQLIDTIDIAELDTEVIGELLSNEVLVELTDAQTEALISSIAEADLTDEQAEQIALTLSEAPDGVKEEFESQINVFGGQFDSYVPTGSNVSVGVRRVIVAATAVVFAMPTPTTRVRK